MDPYTAYEYITDDDEYWENYIYESWAKALIEMSAGAKQVGITFENLKKKIDDVEAKTKSDWEERHRAWIDAVARVNSPLVLFPTNRNLVDNGL